MRWTRRKSLVDLTQRAVDQAPEDDRDWLVALEVAVEVQDLEWAMQAANESNP